MCFIMQLMVAKTIASMGHDSLAAFDGSLTRPRLRVGVHRAIAEHTRNACGRPRERTSARPRGQSRASTNSHRPPSVDAQLSARHSRMSRRRLVDANDAPISARTCDSGRPRPSTLARRQSMKVFTERAERPRRPPPTAHRYRKLSAFASSAWRRAGPHEGWSEGCFESDWAATRGDLGDSRSHFDCAHPRDRADVYVVCDIAAVGRVTTRGRANERRLEAAPSVVARCTKISGVWIIDAQRAHATARAPLFARDEAAIMRSNQENLLRVAALGLALTGCEAFDIGALAERAEAYLCTPDHPVCLPGCSAGQEECVYVETAANVRPVATALTAPALGDPLICFRPAHPGTSKRIDVKARRKEAPESEACRLRRMTSLARKKVENTCLLRSVLACRPR